MTTTTVPQPQYGLSANEQFKAKYGKYIRNSALVGFLIILAMFIFSPKYVPKPYTLRSTVFEAVDMQEEAIELPPPPEDVPRPQAVVEVAPDDEVGEEIDIAESLFDDFESIPVATGDASTGTGEGFVVSQEKPKLVKFVPPDYPEMARASQLEGTVMVKVYVGTDGSVLDAIVIQGVHPMIDNAAKVAARKCKFTPGKQRNIPVKVWMAIPFRFRLHS